MKKLFLALASFAFVAAGFAGELGQAASPLKITEWVKGKPVDLAATKDKQVVVVEFWATWCPPCIKSIPHLTDMAKKFKDVQFVGVSSEKADVVKKFVAKMGDKMDYNVAIDDDGKTSAGYMEEFGIGGIPHAFIVDKQGRVVWHGHPMDGLDKAIKLSVKGFKKNASPKGGFGYVAPGEGGLTSVGTLRGTLLPRPRWSSPRRPGPTTAVRTSSAASTASSMACAHATSAAASARGSP